ncbi:uncharacterized protein [Macrobrachium rosenbergii]|uniref:uncharacterized protein isoform X1 n=1 Tax=Macrobrachium rosenbergii TaxID=79674 RepID=UPI0034D67ECA
MKNLIISLLLLGVIAVTVFARPDESQGLQNDSEEEEEKRPYSFAWAASRYYHGIPDREHQEQRGEDGITRGVFRYVDPRLQVQEVVYYADEDGFHVDASNLPKDTEAVENARFSHNSEFERIRQEHARIAAERAILEAQEAGEVRPVDPVQQRQDLIKSLPKNTVAVENLRARHAKLFEKIRDEHALIAAERKQQEALEAAEEGNYQ